MDAPQIDTSGADALRQGNAALLQPPSGSGAEFLKADQALARAQGEAGKVTRESKTAMDASAVGTPRPQLGELQKVPDKPSSTVTGEMAQQWLSTAALVAGIAGALSRQHVTTALNAFGAVVKGAKEGNLDAAKAAYEDWKAASEAVNANNKAMIEKYDAVIKDRTLDANELSARLRMIGLEHQDAITVNLAQAQRFIEIGAKIDALRSAADQHEEVMAKIASTAEAGIKAADAKAAAAEVAKTRGTPQELATRQFLSENPGASAADVRDFVVSMQHQGKSTPQEQALEQFRKENPNATAAEMAAFTQKSRAAPRSGPAMFLQKFMDENPNATSEQVENAAAGYRARGNAVSAFATGKQGDIVRSFNTASAHLQTLDELADALKNNDMRAFNAVGQRWSKETGNPAPTNFDTARTIIGNEIVKAVIGAAGTGEDRTRAQAAFEAANSPETLHGATNTIRTLIKGQLSGLEKQYVDTTGQTEEDFRKRLSGAALQMLAGGAGAAKSGGASHTLNGRGIVVKDGAWVFTDTGEKVPP